MNKLQDKLFTVLIVMHLCFCAPSYSQMDKVGNLPNIIIFLVDDMGLMDTSVPFIMDSDGNLMKFPLNNYYKTPNMEKLANQGIRFSNFYAHSVCSPTRSSIMTGQNSARHAVTNWINPYNNNRTEFGPLDWNWEGLSRENVTIPRILHQQGYRTIHVGKAHFAPAGFEGEDPVNLGFDVNIAGSSIGHPGSYHGKDGFGNIRGSKSHAVPGLEKYWNKDIFLTEALTLEANTAISQSKKDGKPFFLYMSHYAVHSPFQVDPRFIHNYAQTGMSKKAQAYATLIEGIDKSLGDIISHVKNLGMGEDTLILFLGDNGSDAPLEIVDDYSSSSPLKGKKGNHWEGGMRVPFIASWISPSEQSSLQKKLPIAQGAAQTQMGSVIDLFPTIANLTNSTIPRGHMLDGFDLIKQLEGQKNKKRQNVFLNHFPHKHRSDYYTSLVKNDWKVVYHYPIDGMLGYELFNLKTDPFETTNLAEAKTKELRKMMKSLEKELKGKGALLPVKDGKIVRVIVP